MTCEGCGELAALGRRYRLDRILHRAPGVTTYHARDLSTRQTVVAVEYALPEGQDGVVCRFEAALERLQELVHPGVVRTVDHCVAEHGRERRLGRVHAWVEGWSLQQEADEHRHTELEVVGVLEELLAILADLHSQKPPLVHGDLHAGTVLRTVDDRRLVLIHPGALRELILVPGQRWSAPFGHLAPEVLLERHPSTPAADLFSVGALAVRLLSGIEPRAMRSGGQGLDWEPHLQVHPELARVLRSLLQIDPSRRPTSAATVRAAIRTLGDQLGRR